MEEDRFGEGFIAWEMSSRMKTIAVMRTIETDRLRDGERCIDGIYERIRSPATVYILLGSCSYHYCGLGYHGSLVFWNGMGLTQGFAGGSTLIR